MDVQQPTPAEWHGAVLKALKNRNGFLVNGLSQGDFHPAVLEQMPSGTNHDPRAIHQTVWTLIRQGLAFLDFQGDGIGGNRFEATLRLTDAGEAAANEEGESPHNPEVFFDRLQRKVPNASDVVLQYAHEAITAYRNLCDLASTVMIGVASEAAFLEMAQAFDKWLGDSRDRNGVAFRTALNDPKGQPVKTVFDRFTEAFKTNTQAIPRREKEGVETDFYAVFTLLRIYRTDAGHPSTAVIEREDVSNHLRMLPRYLQRLYALKAFFEENPSSAVS